MVGREGSSEDPPGPRDPGASSREPVGSRAVSRSSRVWYPAWTGSDGRGALGFGYHEGRLASTATTTRDDRWDFAAESESDFEEWPGSFSSDAVSAIDEDGNSSSQFRSDFPIGPGVAARLGRYQVLDILGEGQFAQVYRGYDPILERAVALKVHRPGIRPFVEMKERFLGEARALARMRHPAIVPVYELGCQDDRCYIVMALIEGQNLAESRLRDPRSIDFRRAAEIVADLAEAVDYAHGQGILHRDIKPANILFDESGSVYLTDFGLAYRPDSGELPTPRGTRIGTPAYSAPELASGDHPVALPAGDQYSLGAIFYELLCGRTPFSGPPLYVLYQAMNQAPPSPRSVEPAVPAPLAAICMKMLATAPEARYPSCAELAKILRRWLRDEGT